MADDEMERFEQLYRLAERLIVKATKDALAEAARIPDLNLAQCQTKYGELPADEYVSLADGMENLVGILGNLTSHDQDDDSVY